MTALSDLIHEVQEACVQQRLRDGDGPAGCLAFQALPTPEPVPVGSVTKSFLISANAAMGDASMAFVLTSC